MKRAELRNASRIQTAMRRKAERSFTSLLQDEFLAALNGKRIAFIDTETTDFYAIDIPERKHSSIHKNSIQRRNHGRT